MRHSMDITLVKQQIRDATEHISKLSQDLRDATQDLRDLKTLLFETCKHTHGIRTKEYSGGMHSTEYYYTCKDCGLDLYLSQYNRCETKEHR
jgi:hypothetical protein